MTTYNCDVTNYISRGEAEKLASKANRKHRNKDSFFDESVIVAEPRVNTKERTAKRKLEVNIQPGKFKVHS